MAYSHWLRRKRVKNRRTFAGADLAKRLVKWLDANEGSEACARIVDLLGDFQAVAPLMQPMGEVREFQIERGRFSLRGRLLSPGGPRCLALAKKLNRKLARYSAYPQFACGIVDPYWMFVWKSAKRKYAYVRPVDPSRLSEAEAALRVVDLARDGYITRILRCRCGKGWFFAKFRHQVFCGPKCQQTYYRTSEQFKTQRRIYMRKYRRLVQSKNVK